MPYVFPGTSPTSPGLAQHELTHQTKKLVKVSEASDYNKKLKKKYFFWLHTNVWREKGAGLRAENLLWAQVGSLRLGVIKNKDYVIEWFPEVWTGIVMERLVVGGQ